MDKKILSLMTKKEAIKYLQQLYPNGGHCWLDEQRIDAIDMAVKALQEEPVSEDLDEAARKAGQKYFPDEYNIWARPNYEAVKVEYAFKEGAKWQEEHLIGKMEQFLYEELSNGDIECRDMKFLIEYLKLYMKEKLYERIR